MIKRILMDSNDFPLLFCWNGAIDKTALEVWKNNTKHYIHPDVLSLWQVKGGGDVFETEVILSPFHEVESEAVLPVSQQHWNRGLARDSLVFHRGFFITTMRDEELPIVCCRPETHEEVGAFPDLDSWYVSILREEYQSRYGLARL